VEAGLGGSKDDRRVIQEKEDLLHPGGEVGQGQARPPAAFVFGSRPFLGLGLGLGDRGFEQIPFVDGNDAGLAGLEDDVGNLLVLFEDPAFGIENEHDQIAAADGGLGPLHTEELDRVIHAPAFADPGGVDQDVALANPFGFHLERDVDGVAGGAGLGTHHDSLGTGEGIDQGGLPDVGTPDDRQFESGLGSGDGILGAGRGKQGHRGVQERYAATIMDGADREQAAETELVKLRCVRVLSGQVDLVGGHQHRFSGGTEPRGDFEIERQQSFLGVNHEQQRIGHLQGDLHLVHSGPGDRVRRFFAAHQPDAAGVHQGKRPATMLGFGTDTIPRDTGLIMHDGDPPSHHPVEEGGLADIGTTHDSDEARHNLEDGGVGTAGEGQRMGRADPTSWVAFPHSRANLGSTMELPAQSFPDFSLARLLKTVFAPESGQRICILIDLPEPRRVRGFEFLQDDTLTVQRHAHDVFYQGLKAGVLTELGLRGGDLFAYEVTGGSNLDLPDAAWTPEGTEVSLVRDVYPNFDIILCISTYSATAPLTAFAKQIGFRGATLHGLNPIILRTGLAVDYNEVSREAEKMRSAMTRADAFEIDFEVAGQRCTLKLLCDRQEAQKSHGLCRGKTPDVANLPAGEVYFVPTGAEGRFPMKYEDGTLGLMEVSGGRIRKATLLSGEAATVEAHNQRLTEDPVTGEIGELGFGTQLLPPSGRDIQDEKIRGTLHVATGRSDHLGGHLTPDKFKVAMHATHDDILFSPTKTPEISVPQVRMLREGQVHVVIENYQPAAYIEQALAS